MGLRPWSPRLHGKSPRVFDWYLGLPDRPVLRKQLHFLSHPEPLWSKVMATQQFYGDMTAAFVETFNSF